MPTRNNRKSLKYYIAELVILILGISLSFALNEWRLKTAEHDQEGALLSQFAENLKRDSLNLVQNVAQGKYFTKFSNNLLLMDRDADFNDSLSIKVASIMSYGNFYPTDIGYQEMRSLGNSKIIRNKKLLKDLIALYQGEHELLAEWASVDKNFILNQLIPYGNSHLPFALGLNYSSLNAGEKRKLMNALSEDEMKYLIQYNLIIKSALKGLYENTLKTTSKLLEDIHSELEL